MVMMEELNDDDKSYRGKRPKGMNMTEHPKKNMATHAFCIDRILCAYIKEQQQQQHRKMKPIKVEKKKKKKGTKLKAKTIRIFGG
ncbi:hypothetical protein RDWZM_005084 [Blomia tropicalis]|uniref:Uncharacterized protein n=1 Tax=Blomia tropicalis TaxID=40697 RepID=A0A9Q0M810_BLOTA|nr:hypothetical protein RDWZM_005084 [Blomia tropicalis]